MKKLMLLLASALAVPGYACVTCNAEVRNALFGSSFAPMLLAVLPAFLSVVLLVIIIATVALKRPDLPAGVLSRRPLAAAAMVLGIGLGGFADGILFHQVLQWHNMFSAQLPPADSVAKSVNMFWDGIFHAATFLITLTGVLLLWKVSTRPAVDRSGRLLAGGLLAGWAIFNLVEGVTNHHVLALHNVRENSIFAEAWNYSFLGLSLLFLVCGVLLIRSVGRHVVRTIPPVAAG